MNLNTLLMAFVNEPDADSFKWNARNENGVLVV
jgi:hypothetical protein